MVRLKKTIFALGAAAVLTVATLMTAPAATARQNCMMHDDAVAQLAKKFDEQVSARGLTPDGKQMFEVVSSEKGTWTLIITDVHGKSCVVATGEAWHLVETLPGQSS